ncbi:hypothetical protein LSAT2_025764, partial [Lamellibrachia satsuma]
MREQQSTRAANPNLSENTDAVRPRRTRTREAVYSEMTDHARNRWNVSTANELTVMHASVDSRPPSRDNDRMFDVRATKK